MLIEPSPTFYQQGNWYDALSVIVIVTDLCIGIMNIGHYALSVIVIVTYLCIGIMNIGH